MKATDDKTMYFTPVIEAMLLHLSIRRVLWRTILNFYLGKSFHIFAI